MAMEHDQKEYAAAKAEMKRKADRFFSQALQEEILGKDSDNKPVKLRLKHAVPKQSNPGSWKDNEVTDENKPLKGAGAQDKAPLRRPWSEEWHSWFPNGSMIEDPKSHELLTCKMCKKPVLRQAMAKHIKNCVAKKQEKQKKKKEAKEAKDAAARKAAGLDDDDDDEEDKKPGARKATKKEVDADDDDGDAKKTNKKRKADTELTGDKATKKQKKKEEAQQKAKNSKQKGPVDVEKQCGVPLEKGGQCARSLTCKSHSMGAKRSVPGRSLPYDMLLAQYQKKNQAKQQKAALDANKPLIDEFDEANGPVNSDEERDAVLAGFARSQPRPLTAKPLTSMQAKYRYVRMKEMLHQAMGGRGGTGLFAVPSRRMDGEAGGGSLGTGATAGGLGPNASGGAIRRISLTATTPTLGGPRTGSPPPSAGLGSARLVPSRQQSVSSAVGA